MRIFDVFYKFGHRKLKKIEKLKKINLSNIFIFHIQKLISGRPKGKFSKTHLLSKSHYPYIVSVLSPLRGFLKFHHFFPILDSLTGVLSKTFSPIRKDILLIWTSCKWGGCGVEREEGWSGERGGVGTGVGRVGDWGGHRGVYGREWEG